MDQISCKNDEQYKFITFDNFEDKIGPKMISYAVEYCIDSFHITASKENSSKADEGKCYQHQ